TVGGGPGDDTLVVDSTSGAGTVQLTGGLGTDHFVIQLQADANTGVLDSAGSDVTITDLDKATNDVLVLDNFAGSNGSLDPGDFKYAEVGGNVVPHISTASNEAVTIILDGAAGGFTNFQDFVNNSGFNVEFTS